MLNEHGQVYHAITHADGFYRDVFKKFKGNFERIFMMGVSPVTHDVTSGYNVDGISSIEPEFDEMLGFSTKDVGRCSLIIRRWEAFLQIAMWKPSSTI